MPATVSATVSFAWAFMSLGVMYLGVSTPGRHAPNDQLISRHAARSQGHVPGSKIHGASQSQRAERTERDSNPRYGNPYAGFQNQCLRPLSHPSHVDQDPTQSRNQALTYKWFESTKCSRISSPLIFLMRVFWSGFASTVRSMSQYHSDSGGCGNPGSGGWRR